MRSSHRILSTVIALGAVFPVGLPVANASEVKLPVEISAWFWDDQQDDTSVTTTPAATSGVPAGDLAVAITTGAAEAAEVQPNNPDDPSDDESQKRSNKETFLQWDLSAYPEGSIVDKFLVTLFVDPAAHNMSLPALDLSQAGQTDRGGQPNLIACRPLIGFGEGEGIGYISKPALDCRDSFSGQYDVATNSYTFDIGVFAQDWVDGTIDNRGIGIRAEVDEDDPFNIAFLPAAKVLTLADITAALPEVDEPDLAPIPDTGSAATGSSGGSVYQPAPVIEPAPAPAPAAVPAPVAAKPPVNFTNAAGRPVERDLTVGPSFWLALVAGVGVLGVMSLVLGDPIVPVRGQRGLRPGRPSPVAATLRARRTGVAIRPRSI